MNVVGQEFELTKGGLQRTGKIIRFQNLVDSNGEQNRYQLSTNYFNHLGLPLISNVVGILSNAFNLMNINNYMYVGTIIVENQSRDIYIPNQHKHHFKSFELINY
mgnify:FL=1|tara:strand:+ start:538 stop:852 length:315 start_codon:yes stop_codon:yes gene_type:complete